MINWRQSYRIPFNKPPYTGAEAGLKFGRFHGEDIYTTKESERLTRLPMYYGLAVEEVDAVIGVVKDFYA